MAIYRKSYKPKTFKKRTTKKTGVSTAVKKYVKTHSPRPELKRVWANLTESTTLNTFSQQYALYDVSSIAQGTQIYAREGNQVRLKWIQIKGLINNNVAKVNYARFILCKIPGDMTTGNSTAGTFKLFDNTLTGAGVSANLVSSFNTMYARIDKSKIHVYKDFILKLGMSTDTTGACAKMFNINQKLNTLIKYQGNTSGEYNQDYRIVLVVLVAEAAQDESAIQTVELSWDSNTWFSDV